MGCPRAICGAVVQLAALIALYFVVATSGEETVDARAASDLVASNDAMGQQPPPLPQPRSNYTLTIAVISNNREKSLRRLCDSLMAANYHSAMDVFSRIDLAFNMEASSSASVLNFVVGLRWIYGVKRVRKRVRQGGLITAVTESWYPAHDGDYGLILEDDIEVSVHYLAWINAAMVRQLKQPDPRLVGIALYSPRLTETTVPKRKLNSNELTKGLTGREESPYLLQTPCSWGAVYFPSHWREFLMYLQVRQSTLDEPEVEVPGSSTNVWSGSWKKFFFELMYIRGTYMLYPNFKGQASFSTNHMEPGEHIQAKEVKWRRPDFVVPLLKDRSKLTALPKLLSAELPVLNWFASPLLTARKLSSELDALAGGAVRPIHVPGSRLLVTSEPSDMEGLATVVHQGSRHKKHSRHMFRTRVYTPKVKRSKKDNSLPKDSIGKFQLMEVIHSWDTTNPNSNCTTNILFSVPVMKKQRDDKAGHLYTIRLTDRGSLEAVQIMHATGQEVVLWASPEDPTYDEKPESAHPGYHAMLESDGNLVVYPGVHPVCDGSRKVWQTNTSVLQFTPLKRCKQSRAEVVCSSIPPSVSSFFTDAGAFTIMVSTMRRYDMLMHQVAYYSLSPLVSTFIITWHNLHVLPPDDAVINGKMVRFVAPETDSLNNRFNPLLVVTTQAVLIMDDDMMVHHQDLHSLFHAWRNNPKNLVGFMPRWVDGAEGITDDRVAELTYRVESEEPPGPVPRTGYSLMLTKVLMLHRDFLSLYTCGARSEALGLSLPPGSDDLRRFIHGVVDENINCEDIGMNVLASAALHMSGRAAAPLFVQPLHRVADFGKKGGGNLHLRKGHTSSRSDCLRDMHAMFRKLTGANLPLQTYIIETRRVDDRTVVLSKVKYKGLHTRLHDDCQEFAGSGGCGAFQPPRTVPDYAVAEYLHYHRQGG